MVIGVGMIPCGEVGLIFAQMGLEKLKDKGFDVTESIVANVPGERGR
ncbi:MAG TPA: hypothetical protein VMG10_23840 [Gemmataceae bacterium]|nr:hypothetical protein [Gemmataceae bacterium]